MDQIIALIRQFINIFKIWMIVMPWEQAVRVRLGKHTETLEAGCHLKLPFVDSYYVQSTRKRNSVTGRQTILMKDGIRNAIVATIVGYTISDVLKLYSTLHHAEDTIRNMVMAEVVTVICELDDLSPLSIGERVTKNINFEQYGLSNVEVCVAELSIARTYRIMGDYAQMFQNGTALHTESENPKT